ncbi:MAG: HMA2 domain-containing protein [Paracoccaceae bacterium]
MPADDAAFAGNAPVALERAHVIARRARLRAAGLERDALVALADRLAALPGVARALVRPSTGSVIIETHEPVEAVLGRVAEAGIARIQDPPQRPPVGQVMQMGLARASTGMKDRTGGALDLDTAIALALLAGSILQLSRGRVAGPATTLAMGALTLLEKSKRI